MSVTTRRRELEAVRDAAAACRACPLWECGTQTVFGEGDPAAKLLLVGEQPGDREDVEGAPFVGPAGHVLDRALRDAGIDRESVYLTNAVKHFKWEARGKRRIHKKPNAAEVRACHPWLEQEVALVRPELIVALGATAAQSVLGRAVPVTKHRGEIFESSLGPVGTTVHPSSILRGEPADREVQFNAFVSDLRKLAAVVRP